MDDKRIERALRQGPLDEPDYDRVISQRISDAADPGDRAVRRVGNVGVRVKDRPKARPQPGWALAAIVSIALVVVGTFAFRYVLGPGGVTPTAAPEDRLAHLRATGVIRIAITTEAPQTISAGGSYIGYDVDVAGELASQLGLRPELVLLPPEEIVGDSSAWDVALISRPLPTAVTVSRTGQPYYLWPSWLVLSSSSQAEGLEDLAGEVICVVDGSVGAHWLAGRSMPGVNAGASPPPGSVAVERGSEEDCLAEIVGGTAAAAITSTLLEEELADRGVRPLNAEPLLLEHRSVTVAGAGNDTASLVQAIDGAIGRLHASGRLAELSRQSFGGRDLSQSWAP